MTTRTWERGGVRLKELTVFRFPEQPSPHPPAPPSAALGTVFKALSLSMTQTEPGALNPKHPTSPSQVWLDPTPTRRVWVRCGGFDPSGAYLRYMCFYTETVS